MIQGLDPQHLESYNASCIWAGRADVWVGGSTDYIGDTMDPALLVRFDGTTWSARPAGRWTVDAIWGDGEGGVWLALPGIVDNLDGSWKPYTLRHDDGVHAMTVPIGDWPEHSVVHSLWGRARNDVWAAGDDVAHFDGRSWSRVAGVPAAVVSTGNSGQTLVTGDEGSVWLVANGPRFFRKTEDR